TEGRVAEIAYVPLLVKAPGQTTGSVDDRNVQGVDLLPTLADLVGVEIPWEVDGRPACELPPDPGGPKVIMDFSSGTFAPQSEPSLTIEFTASEHRPSADLRLVGPVEEGEHPLAGLLRLIDADRWLGVPVDEL